MSRLDTTSRGAAKPALNVYTGLAAISFLMTLLAMGYAIWLFLKQG